MNTCQKLLISSLFLLLLLLGSLTGNAQSMPDFQWNPEPFHYKAGDSQRYIDYEMGNDNNPGTMAKPWKHHPWDPQASGNAAATKGVHTYVFKKGVTYRGQLIANESGEMNNPIRLTVDPNWGKGEAEIAGSMKVSNNWKKYKEKNGLPFPKSSSGKIWYIDLDIDFDPKSLWAFDNKEIIRIPVAREPDWSITNPDDPKTQWWEWTDHKYTGTLSVETTKGFSAGDRIWTLKDEESDAYHYIRFEADKVRKDREASPIVITGISEKGLEVECSDYASFKLNGKTLTNGKVITKATNDIINRNHRMIDTMNLSGKDPDFYNDATVWTEQLSYAGYGHPAIIEQFSPEEQSVVLSSLVPWLEGQKRSPGKYCRYYLENKPQFLDSPGEYFFDSNRKGKGGRLFLRLPGDENPNKARVEIARHPVLIEIRERNHIEISGLSFRFENIDDWLATSEKIAAIQLLGNCSNITISHCQFEHVIKALSYYPLRDGDVGDYIKLKDSDIKHTDHNAIALRYGLGGVWGFHKRSDNNPLGRLKHVSILRNNLYNIGDRPPPGEGCHAIEIKGGELVEIAYNVIDRTYASGIQALNNRWSGGGHGRVGHKLRSWESPLNRCLIHHNKVTNTMLQGNDWGSIASWGIGPSYVYSNISGNSLGYRHSFYREGWPKDHDFDSFFSLSNTNFGTAFYFDNMHKGYLFNNIAWGKNNNVEDRYYNTYGYFQTKGTLNHIFQNTFYKFAIGTMTFDENFRVMGNLYLDIGYSHLVHSAKVINSTAYTNNGFNGDVKAIALSGGKTSFSNLNDFQRFLEKDDPYAFKAGFVLQEENVRDASAHDFRLEKDAPGIDQGVKVFVPWGLFKSVGEWHFYKDRANPSRIMDEHYYLNDEYQTIPMFTQIPRHDLTGYHFLAEDYHTGQLEDWVEGALNFNGKNQYCSILDSSTKNGYSWKTSKESGSYPGEKRVTLDAGTGNFLIEVVFKLNSNETGSALVSKGNDQQGYHLVIDENGKVQLQLGFGKNQYTATSHTAVNDDQWHHLIAELDRKTQQVRIYIDGKHSQIAEKGTLATSASLTNQNDFTVGRFSTKEAGFFHGSIDFLRLSQGTLMDAETTIEELYKWEFDGPFLKDFYGNKTTGTTRDVGALEGN